MEKLPTKENLLQPKIEIRQEKSLEFIAQSIKNYEDVGDEEAVFMLALTLDHPEWKETILEQIKKYKPHVQNVEKILERLNKDYFSSGWQSQIKPNAEDAMWWAEHLPEKKEQIAKLLTYFNPSPNEVVKKIIVIPSDQLLPHIQTGCSFGVGDTTVIMSHTLNPENFEHEFLHSIVNPITEKFEGEIPQEKVIALASDELKEGQGYGDHALSLLNEELIRTYHDRINIATDGISSLPDFQTRIDEYLNKNELEKKIYHLYERFDAEKSIHPEVRFEDFFTREIKGLFD